MIPLGVILFDVGHNKRWYCRAAQDAFCDRAEECMGDGVVVGARNDQVTLQLLCAAQDASAG